MTQALLQFKNVNSYYDKKLVLENLNISIGKGEIVSIIGPNGSGKSTFLKTIMNQVSYKGQVTLNGIDSKQMLSHITFMPQTDNIDKTFPLTVADVVSMSQSINYSRFKLVGHLKRDENIEQFLNVLKILDLKDKSINELSGGQLQRVFLARSLARGGDLILLDEPLNEVDVLTEKLILDEIESLRSKGKTILISNHDLPIAKKISTKILLLNKRIVAYGTAKEVFNKQSLFEAFGDKIVIVNEKDDFIVPDHVY